MLHHRLVAHRGYQRLYPENTILGVRQALAQHAAYIEVDIQFTQDLQPVIYHDSTLIRVSGLAGEVRQMMAADILNTPAHEPFRLGEKFQSEKIAHLNALVEFVGQHPEVKVFVELKEEAIAWVGVEQAFAIVADVLRPVARQIILISFDAPFIAVARHRKWPCIGLVLKAWDDIGSDLYRQIQPDYVFASDRLLPETESLPPLEALLVVYEIDQPETAMELFNRGVDMVETFDIGGMMDGLASHCL